VVEGQGQLRPGAKVAVRPATGRQRNREEPRALP